MNKLRKFFAAAALAGLFLLPSLAEAGVRVYVRFGPPKVRTVKVVKHVRPCAKAIWSQRIGNISTDAMFG